MADSWTLVTPSGDYQLNPTFSAAAYEPGSVAPPGALRRDDRTAYQRSGDGLRTPGALVLSGFVWSDARDIPAMVAERNAIQAAVNSATAVVRTNQAGTYTYSDLAGGPTLEVVPDGAGGWSIRIELWPGRAEATFAPSGSGGDVTVLAVGTEWHPYAGGARTLDIAIPGGPAPANALVILSLYGSGSITGAHGMTSLGNGLIPLESQATMGLWAFSRTLPAPASTLSIDVLDYYGITHTAVMTGANLATADVVHTSVDWLDANTPLGLAGPATRGGRQFLIGNGTGFGIG